MASLSVAIATYRREGVLLDTLVHLLALDVPPAEILVIDQTEHHAPETVARLQALREDGHIRWLRQSAPSIPKAMNLGLLEARQPIVLFLDDDIRPEPGLIAAHGAAHQQFGDILVAGRVIQPWEEETAAGTTSRSKFAGLQPGWISEFMGGNFSVRRDTALRLGGFDENFVRVAYHFEAEFAHRFVGHGGRIYFEPAACIHHLKAEGGGTRSYGDHLTTGRPDHAVGAHYYFLRSGQFARCLSRPLRAVATRHHLRRPWWIPVTLLAELHGLLWALTLHARGPRYATTRSDP